MVIAWRIAVADLPRYCHSQRNGAGGAHSRRNTDDNAYTCLYFLLGDFVLPHRLYCMFRDVDHQTDYRQVKSRFRWTAPPILFRTYFGIPLCKYSYTLSYCSFRSYSYSDVFWKYVTVKSPEYRHCIMGTSKNTKNDRFCIPFFASPLRSSRFKKRLNRKGLRKERKVRICHVLNMNQNVKNFFRSSLKQFRIRSGTPFCANTFGCKCL